MGQVPYGPPDIPADELVMRLSERDLPSRVIDFPSRGGAGNKGGKLRIQILKAMDKTKAKAEAGQIVRNQLKENLGREPSAEDMSTDYAREMVNDALVASLICMFCRSVNPIGEVGEGRRVTYGRIFKSAPWVLNNLSSDEISILMLEYQVMEVEDGPREQVLLDDPFILRLWIDKAKQGAWKLGPFASMAFLDLAELCRFSFQVIDKAQSLGFDILDPRSLPLLSASKSQSETSTSGTSSSGKQPASSDHSQESHSSTPETISVDEAKKRARKLREQL